VAKEKMVLAVGRLSYQKGFDMLLDIWYQTKCRDDGWKLVIIGQGELLEQLETKKEFLGISSSVEILPANPQIESLYARSSLYVMSSRWEGLPLVLIESTSAGLPIVSFDCETGPRDIVKNGYNGYLVECFNLSDFASIIDKLCEDKELMRKMSDNSRVKSLEFNLESIIKQWNNILK